MPRSVRRTVSDARTLRSRLALGQSWGLRALLFLVALAGSVVYGASLSLVLPAWGAVPAAAWLALSAGLAWAVFIPALAWITRARLWRCLDASLVTMAAGEVVLMSGVLVNGMLWMLGVPQNAAAVNAGVVAISNVTMATMLACILRAVGVPIWKTVTAWMLVLNGSGLLLFLVFHQLLHG